MREAILKALEDKYNAQISEADATLKIYLENAALNGMQEPIYKFFQKFSKKQCADTGIGILDDDGFPCADIKHEKKLYRLSRNANRTSPEPQDRMRKKESP